MFTEIPFKSERMQYFHLSKHHNTLQITLYNNLRTLVEFLDQSIYALFAPPCGFSPSPRPTDFYLCPAPCIFAPPRPAGKCSGPSIPGTYNAKKIINNDIPTLLYLWFPDSCMGCFCVRVQNKVRFKLLPKAKAACLEFGWEVKSVIEAKNPPFQRHHQAHQVPGTATRYQVPCRREKPKTSQEWQLLFSVTWSQKLTWIDMCHEQKWYWLNIPLLAQSWWGSRCWLTWSCPRSTGSSCWYQSSW